jgi:hypothetical protein
VYPVVGVKVRFFSALLRLVRVPLTVIADELLAPELNVIPVVAPSLELSVRGRQCDLFDCSAVACVRIRRAVEATGRAVSSSVRKSPSWLALRRLFV